jgi:hypothetical protein
MRSEKRALKETRKSKMIFRITYKQALRGLFVTGTSPASLRLTIREKVSDEPGLKTQNTNGSVLHNLAGKNRKKK